jgi:hypothetical protein
VIPRRPQAASSARATPLSAAPMLSARPARRVALSLALPLPINSAAAGLLSEMRLAGFMVQQAYCGRQFAAEPARALVAALERLVSATAKPPFPCAGTSTPRRS